MNTSELKLIHVKIQFNSCYCGVSLSRIELPPKCAWLGIVRTNRVILASAEPTIFFGDDILAIAINGGYAPALEVLLKKTHPVLWSDLSCSLTRQSQLPNQLILGAI